MDDDALTQENEEIRAFFTQWHSYKRAVEFNYLHHREAYGSVHEWLKSRAGDFSILDLACGDSSNTVAALQGTGVTDYTGVDFSKPALKLARATIGQLTCPARLVEESFVSFIDRTTESWDVIFIGLSFHHLVGEEKQAFATKLRSRIKPGGAWIFFEPVFRGAESRAEYVEQWWQHIRQHWTQNTPEELESFHAHVSQYDYPETPKRFAEIASKAGFSSTEMLYCDPDRFYAVFTNEV